MRAFSKLLAPLARRLRLMIGRSTITLTNDNKKLQELQVTILSDDVGDEIERFQEYGFTSRPKSGAEAIILCVGGSRAHAIAVAVDDRRYRLKPLAEGEVALYTDEGDYIHFKRGHVIEVMAGAKVKVTAPEVEVIASTKVTLDTPLTHVTGALQVDGTAAVTGALSSATSVADPNGTMQAMRNIYNTHTHPENDNGGPTAAPNQPM